MSDTPASPRTATAVDAVADALHDAVVEASPITATHLGLHSGQTELDDLSPQGYEHRVGLARDALRRLEGVDPVDDIDRVTVAAMRERLGLEVEVHEAGLDTMELNVIASPLQGIRDVFDLMPTASEEDWATIAARLGRVPTALSQWTGTLRGAAGRGDVSPRRQVEKCIAQCGDLTAPDGYFADLVGRARVRGQALDGAVAADLRAGAEAAAAAYRRLGEDLATHLLPHAPESDAAGIDRYRLASRQFVGSALDLEETYAWGQEEVARIAAEMAATAERIRPGASVKEAIDALDNDPAYVLHGTDALREWMQERADAAVADLAGTHFDIPEPVRTIECRIAPTHTGGIYYTGPSEDFTRPGRMWWSVPRGVTEFGTWRELTTVYHEGVPGHHLQVGQTMARGELLNAWRRNLCWTSGHGEGWALYAEWLMADLGYMDDPGNYLGLLDGQSLRAARVVIDIGVHCGFEAPAEVGGGAWTYGKAWQYLDAHANQGEAMMRFELDRYLGWPGQAPSYKVGERLWLQLRDELASREGSAFSLKDFHRRALDVGSVGLDVLREALLG
ncbi:MAG TPA: DUF885 domain-containing protein [Phycicoccus sp.]|nr:DUF885 domain-containing protein [Phycicoccus sp.]